MKSSTVIHENVCANLRLVSSTNIAISPPLRSSRSVEEGTMSFTAGSVPSALTNIGV